MNGALLRLSGDLASSGLLPWIERRAKLLSLTGWARRENDSCVTIAVVGQSPLIDAMEAACSLGPFDVLVEEIQREDTSFTTPPNDFEVAI